MMKLSKESLKDREAWKNAGIKCPEFDTEKMLAATKENPTWVHFGSGNLFRAFHAMLQQDLLEQGLVNEGIIAAETFDYEMIDLGYTPFDDLGITVTLMPDGSFEKTVVASVAGAYKCDREYEKDYEALKDIFKKPSLQMITFTITEKGYALTGMDGEFTQAAKEDFAAGPHNGKLAMSKVASLLYERFLAGGKEIAVVSTDNCSHNGEKLREGVVTMAKEWEKNDLVPEEFISWLSDESRVAFPWSMIDKITPRPSSSVEEELSRAGLEGTEIGVTSKGGYTAVFVNAERPQYLVIEDSFPNGRPPLENAGVYFTDRDTVNKVEKMKVTTCLNPLHTALAVYGCLLGYDSIAKEMQDPELKGLVEKIGYDEGMPVVTDPGIIKPVDFIHEVIDERFPNPYMPDTPQRIASDTSQKIPIRYGETIKSYIERDDMKADGLTFIPLAIAGWLRYLLAIDDEGNAFTCSDDPMLSSLQKQLSSVTFGKPETVTADVLKPVLSNETLFATDLCAAGLDEKIGGMLRELVAGKHAVRDTLKKYVTEGKIDA